MGEKFTGGGNSLRDKESGIIEQEGTEVIYREVNRNS